MNMAAASSPVQGSCEWRASSLTTPRRPVQVWQRRDRLQYRYRQVTENRALQIARSDRRYRQAIRSVSPIARAVPNAGWRYAAGRTAFSAEQWPTEGNV